MKTRDMAAEMDFAARSLTDAHRAILANDLGVSPKLLSPPRPMIGLARVRVEGDLFYPDHDGGEWKLITPVRGDYFDMPEAKIPLSSCRSGHLVDLLAWDPHRPHKWTLRAGIGTWLGAIEPQYLDPDPVRVWRTPLEWLRADCTGLVILTHDRIEAHRLLSWLRGGIIIADQSHADELSAILEHPWPHPAITVSPVGRQVPHVAA